MLLKGLTRVLTMRNLAAISGFKQDKNIPKKLCILIAMYAMVFALMALRPPQ